MRSVSGFTTPMSMLDLDLLDCESRYGPQRMSRAAVFLFTLLLAGCNEEKRLTQPIKEMIESPLQNTVISSFDHYPPRPIADADGNFTPIPSRSCADEKQALRILSSAPPEVSAGPLVQRAGPAE